MDIDEQRPFAMPMPYLWTYDVHKWVAKGESGVPIIKFVQVMYETETISVIEENSSFIYATIQCVIQLHLSIISCIHLWTYDIHTGHRETLRTYDIHST
ncbi:MAG: hypothetical protein Q7S05_02110 [bacterium]|nr:hypothetical protein [bacterium]